MTERKEPLSGVTRDTTAKDLLKQVRESKANKEEIRRRLAKLGFVLTRNQELIDLQPFVDSEDERPSDIIQEVNGRLVGEVHFYQLQGDSLKLVERTFDVPIQNKLSSFKYKKPQVEGDVFQPNENWEHKFREGYYPLLIVENALRGPNHWHRMDDGLFCAFKNGDRWETRYFPKQNIMGGIWKHAESILANFNKQSSSEDKKPQLG